MAQIIRVYICKIQIGILFMTRMVACMRCKSVE